MLNRLVAVVALDQEESETVMRRREARLDFERPLVAADGFVHARTARIGDGHVDQDLVILRLLAEREAVRREGSFDIPRLLEGKRLTEVVEAPRVLVAAAAEEAAQP